jgi:putative Holliday junction resolvase
MKFPPTTLAIDFGTVRIGLAISRGSLAEPLAIIPNDEQVLMQIKALCDQEHVQQLIVGLSENEMAEKTKAFVDQLKKAIEVPVEFVDETLSSYTTHQQQLELGQKLAQRQKPIDHLAAAHFLQEWLNEQAA